MLSLLSPSLLFPQTFFSPLECLSDSFFYTLTATAHLEESDFLLPTLQSVIRLITRLLGYCCCCHFSILVALPVVAFPCYLRKLRIYNITFEFPSWHSRLLTGWPHLITQYLLNGSIPPPHPTAAHTTNRVNTFPPQSFCSAVGF